MDHIVLEKYTQPYDPRGWAWMARVDGDDVEIVCGFGATELDAFNDLLSKMDS